MKKLKRKQVRIELTGGYYMLYAHGQYFWIGSDAPGTIILCNKVGTSPIRFAKRVLAIRAAKKGAKP